MKSSLYLVLGLTLTLSVQAGWVNGFDDQAPGAVPVGWTVTMTGQGVPEWTVESEATAPSASNVLKQSGTAAYPLCVNEEIVLKNGFVEVRFKPLSGEKDQAAGIVWRYRDPGNYYIVRANALEDNIVLYKVEQGKRSSLDIVGREGGYGVDGSVPLGQWQTLRIEFADDLFTVLLDGTELFQVSDRTFAEAGQIGLWTKADSVTLFDDIRCGSGD